MKNVLHITEIEDIIAAVNILLKNDSTVTPASVSKYGRQIVSEICGVALTHVITSKEVSVTYANGDKCLPTEITIPWERVDLIVKARDRDTATEDLVRRLVDDRFNALVRGTHNKLVSGELYDKETVDELRRQLDTANNSCTMLQVREAAAINELAEMRDAADRTSRAHKKDITQLNATIKSLQSVNRYTDPTTTLFEAFDALAEQDIVACRLVFRSAANLFPEDCKDLKHVADFDLCAGYFNDKPERVKNYVHAMLDNLNAAGTLHHVTRQMMYTKFAEANQVFRERATKEMLALSDTNQVVGISDKNVERAYRAFRDIVNGEVPPRD